MADINLGHATAYGYARSKGYSGTEEEFAQLMANYGTVGQTVTQAAQTATTKASEAASSASNAALSATNAANSAQEAADIVENIIDDTLTQEGKAADAKATGDAIDELKDDLMEINDVLEYYKREGNNTLINRYTTLAESIDLKKDVEYIAKWTFAQNSSNDVYCYIVDSNDDNVYSGSTNMTSGNSSFIVKFTLATNMTGLTAKVYADNSSGLVGTSCTFEIETATNRFEPIENRITNLLPSSLNNFQLLMPFSVGGLTDGVLNSNKKRISSAETLSYPEALNVKMSDSYRVGYCEYVNNTVVWHGWYSETTIPKGTSFRLQCARQTDETGDDITNPYSNDIMQKMSIIGIDNTSVELENEIRVLSKNYFGHNGVKCETFMNYGLWTQGVACVDDWLVGFMGSNDDHTNTAKYNVMSFKNGYQYHSRGDHNLGHCASADYNSETDTLIVANGTYTSGVVPTIYLVSNAKQAVDNAADILVNSSNVMQITFTNIDGDGCVACFGETSDIVYVMTCEDASDYASNPGKYLYKLALGKGSVDMTSLHPSASFGNFVSGKESDEYNGTAYILKKYTGNYAVELQGMKYVNGRICVSCDLEVNSVLTAYLMFLRTYEQESSLLVDNIYWVPSLASDGSYPRTEAEDIAFADGYAYMTYYRSVLNDSRTIKILLSQ